MNDLSDSSGQQQPVIDVQTATVSSGAKELEPGNINPADSVRDASGQETQLSPEVISAGVKVHPTAVPIPHHIAKMGVKPAGQNIPVQTASAVTLPLTDAQIAVGLHQGITSSVRWLSEWCIKQLKKVHIAVKSVHGNLVRTRI